MRWEEHQKIVLGSRGRNDQGGEAISCEHEDRDNISGLNNMKLTGAPHKKCPGEQLVGVDSRENGVSRIGGSVNHSPNQYW